MIEVIIRNLRREFSSVMEGLATPRGWGAIKDRMRLHLAKAGEGAGSKNAIALMEQLNIAELRQSNHVQVEALKWRASKGGPVSACPD
jgi:hypothetical protein